MESYFYEFHSWIVLVKRRWMSDYDPMRVAFVDGRWCSSTKDVTV